MHDFAQIVDKINTDLPLNRMWDGFWVHEFRKRTLTISCSFDRILYREYDIIFNKVIFFNVPESWRDNNVRSDNLLRLATKEEFEKQQPGFDVRDRLIFAIDLTYYINEVPVVDTYYIVAKHVFLVEAKAPDNHPGSDYIDPLEDEPGRCFENRVR